MPQSGSPQHVVATRLGWTICILGAVFYCYEYLLRIAPAAMVSELRETFHLDATAFGSLIALYYLIYTPMQSIVGLTHDIYGPRRVLIFAVLNCVLGSLLFGIAGESTQLAAFGRLLMGFGSAFAFVGALKLASVWLPANRFALFAGSITALGMFGGMFGNIFMSSFVTHVGWQQTYFVGAASGVVLLILIWVIVKDNPVNAKIHHIKPQLSYRNTFHGLMLIFKSRQMWVTGALACMLYLSLSAFAELWGNDFVEKAYGFSAQDAAKVNSMVFMGWLIGSPLMGFFSDKIRRRRFPLILSAFCAFIISIFMLNVHPSYQIACLLLFLFGLFCSAQNICFALGRENAPAELAGSAVAFVNLIVMAGGLIAQPLIGKLLDHFWTGTLVENVKVYSGDNFKAAMLILPIGLGLAVLASFFVHETRAEMIMQPTKNHV